MFSFHSTPYCWVLLRPPPCWWFISTSLNSISNWYFWLNVIFVEQKINKWTENWDWLLLHPRYTLIYTLYPPYFENHYCNISFALFYRNRQRSWDFKTFSSCHSFLTGCLWLFISTVAFYVCAGNINKQIRTVVKMSSYNGGENWYFGTNCTWIFSLNWKTRWR